LKPLCYVGVHVDKVVQQTEAEEEAEEETVGGGVSVEFGVLDEDCHDEGHSH